MSDDLALDIYEYQCPKCDCFWEDEEAGDDQCPECGQKDIEPLEY
jgi:rubrerythrin